MNHPNIATIYAVEESPEGKALVLELCSGRDAGSGAPVKAVAGARPSFEAGAPVALFDSNIVATAEGMPPDYQYDVTADGKRFLIATTGSTGPAATPTLTVVTNWQVALKK